jgi:hypothetical protein
MCIIREFSYYAHRILTFCNTDAAKSVIILLLCFHICGIFIIYLHLWNNINTNRYNTGELEIICKYLINTNRNIYSKTVEKIETKRKLMFTKSVIS